jgi:hypothetical protein
MSNRDDYQRHDADTLDTLHAALARVMIPGGGVDDAEVRMATLGEIGRIVAAAMGVAWNSLASEPDGETEEELEALTTVGPRMASLVIAGLCTRDTTAALAECIRTDSLTPLRDWLAQNEGARDSVAEIVGRLRLLMRTPSPAERYARVYMAAGTLAAQLSAWAASGLYADRLSHLIRSDVHPVDAVASPDTVVPWARSTTVRVENDGTETTADTQELRRQAEVESFLRALFGDEDREDRDDRDEGEEGGEE